MNEITKNHKKIVKKYFNTYFRSYYLNEDDNAFKTLVRILNKAYKNGQSNKPQTNEDI